MYHFTHVSKGPAGTSFGIMSGTFWFIFSVLLLNGGCGGGTAGDEPVLDMQANLNMEPARSTMSAGDMSAASVQEERISEPGQQQKLITDGRIEFEVDELQHARRQITEAVEHYEAYISSDEEYNFSKQISTELTIRVPADNFEGLLEAITAEAGKLESKQINVRDVSEEFVDIEARLRSKKELENRYIELLGEATAVSDMLEIERQLGQLRSRIESIEGRLRYLENQVSLSTLRVRFYELQLRDRQFGRQFVDDIRVGWDNLLGFSLFMVRLWPFILILIGSVWGIRRWRKRRRKASAP